MRFFAVQLIIAGLFAQTPELDAKRDVVARSVSVAAVTFKGKRALRVTEPPGQSSTSEDKLAILRGIEFGDGDIELDVAGAPTAGAGEGARGFVGVAFRVAPGASKFECLYLRPTNGRADDQLRRNHSLQYISFPDFPWHRLRKEAPGVYESYADLAPAEWTRVKVEVRGVKARLYVHGAAQPALIVNDLKHGVSKGAVGLWIGPGTEAHFANVRITKN
jgi:hypothetical protein